MTVRFRPHLRLIALLAVSSMVAASCGLTRDSASDSAAESSVDGAADGASQPVLASIPDGITAATVTFADGSTTEISSTQLNAFYETMVDDAEFASGAFGPAGIPPGLRASVLSDIVIGAVIDQLLDENDASPSDQNIEDGKAGLEETVASFFPLEEDPAATARARFETLPYLGFLASLQAKQTALGEALVAANSDGATVEVPCSSHILLETEQEALDVIALLDDGGDFAELAMEFSTGPSGPTGGVLGCSDPNGFVPEFRDAIVDAPIGTIIGPVQTDFGFHVITVTAIEEQAVNAPDAQSLVGAELLSTVSQIEVDVDPLLGEWDAARGAVIPPG